MDHSHSIAAGLGILTATLFIFAVLLLPAIFYLLTLQKALSRCAPENRTLNPGLVWLLLIPLFSLAWHFFVVWSMARSLGAEFRQRGMAEDPNPGQNVGLAMCILACCSFIPLLGILSLVGCIVCWIIYWLKIAGYSAKLATAPAHVMA